MICMSIQDGEGGGGGGGGEGGGRGEMAALQKRGENSLLSLSHQPAE